MIFSLKQIQEKCVEQRMPLYMVLVDFTKAFDTVNRDVLWTILGKLGCPAHFTGLVSALHSGMNAFVSLKGKLSDPFKVEKGVKQGCVLAPTLFSIYLGVVLNHAFNDHQRGMSVSSNLLDFITRTHVYERYSLCCPHPCGCSGHHISLRQICPTVCTKDQYEED